MLLLLTFSTAVFAASPELEVPDLFDPAAARRPAAGDWLEYRISYPADPLERRLAAKEGENGAGQDDDPFAITPEFEPPQAWHSYPLRLEIATIDADVCRAVMTFAGLKREVDLPLSAGERDSEFRYPAPQAEDGRSTHRIGDDVYEVSETRRHGGRYGYVRLSNSGLPFGLARFATPDVDIALVGMGNGTPPDFPLPVVIVPPPGELYREEK